MPKAKRVTIPVAYLFERAQGTRPKNRSMIALAGILAATPALAQSPSFDCSKAHLSDEIVICRTPRLAELDNLSAAGYAFLRKTHGRAFADEIGIPFWRQRQAVRQTQNVFNKDKLKQSKCIKL